MQAIQTKYVGPTNYRGTRIIARAAAGRLVFDYDYSLGDIGNHSAAAQALADKLGWGGTWVGGSLPDGSMAWAWDISETFKAG